MKPFDLEKALAGEPVITRDGRDVTQIHCFDVSLVIRPVAAVVAGELLSFWKNGSYHLFNETDFDLFMKTFEKNIWVVVYRGLHSALWSQVFSTETEAWDYEQELRTHASYKFIKTIRTRVEE